MGIEVRDLCFSYGKRQILSEINFSVGEGTLLAVLGPNGVGKSTLFRCMLGFLDGYKGEILLDGQNIRTLDRKTLASKVAYIPQSSAPAFDFAVIDVVLMGLTSCLATLQTPSAAHEAQARKALEELGIAHLENRGYGHISGGERQLVLLARALVQQAKILLMDEPTANLDYGNQHRIMEKIRDLTRHGYTVILSSHDPNQTLYYANRALALQQGRIVLDGPPGEVLTTQNLSELYGIDVIRKFDQAQGVYVCMPGGMKP